MKKLYEPHPWHFIFPIIFTFIGVSIYFKENEILIYTGLAFIFSAAGSYIMIIVNGTIPRYTEYWKELNTFSSTMSRTNNPNLWRAMGFTVPDSTTTVTVQNNTGDLNHLLYERAKFPVPEDILKIIAQGTMDGRKFSEGEWVVRSRVMKSEEFRTLQRDFKNKKYIVYTNPQNTKLGYSFTKKGIDFLRNYLEQHVYPEGLQPIKK